ncbi:hypothetical protein ABIE69_003447, partial [Rhodobacteraceae bacterium MBR-64]
PTENSKKYRQTASCAWLRHYASPHNVQSRAEMLASRLASLRAKARSEHHIAFVIRRHCVSIKP